MPLQTCVWEASQTRTSPRLSARADVALPSRAQAVVAGLVAAGALVLTDLGS